MGSNWDLAISNCNWEYCISNQLLRIHHWWI